MKTRLTAIVGLLSMCGIAYILASLAIKFNTHEAQAGYHYVLTIDGNIYEASKYATNPFNDTDFTIITTHDKRLTVKGRTAVIETEANTR